VQEWCATAFECLERHGFIVRRASLPTPIKDAHPFEGQGAHGRLMRLAPVALRLGVDLGPQGMPRGFGRPLDKRLSQERRTPEAPVDPRRLPAAFRHGRHPRLCLEFLGRSVAFTLFAKGDEEAWGKDRSGPW